MLTFLLVFIAWCATPQKVMGEDNTDYINDTHVDTYTDYTARLSGTNSIAFQLPLYDYYSWHADRWVKEGKLSYIIVDKEGKESPATALLFWSALETSISSDSYTDKAWISVEDFGVYDVTPGIGAPFRLPFGNNNDEWGKTFYVERRPDVEYFTIFVNWIIPREIQGKKVKFRWDVQVEGNLSVKFSFNTTSDIIDVPEGSIPSDPNLSEPIISPESKGKILVPWFISAQTVLSATAHYKRSKEEIQTGDEIGDLDEEKNKDAKEQES